MGSISITRMHNECGKYSPMKIKINGISLSFKAYVDNGETTTVTVPDGDYCVSVKLGKPSIWKNVTINANTVNFITKVIPKSDQAIIDVVELNIA